MDRAPLSQATITAEQRDEAAEIRRLLSAGLSQRGLLASSSEKAAVITLAVCYEPGDSNGCDPDAFRPLLKVGRVLRARVVVSSDQGVTVATLETDRPVGDGWATHTVSERFVAGLVPALQRMVADGQAAVP